MLHVPWIVWCQSAQGVCKHSFEHLATDCKGAVTWGVKIIVTVILAYK